LKTIECFNCQKKGHYSTDWSAPRKNDTENSNMVSKADFKNLFQSSLKHILTKKEKKTKKKENMGFDDKSLDMNVFFKLMEGKDREIVSNYDDDSTSINSTNTLSHSGQNNMTDKYCLDNNYNDNYD
jgi:ribosomal protein L35